MYGGTRSQLKTHCGKHRLEGMIDLQHPRCNFRGCMVQPKFGCISNGRRLFCDKHKAPGMVNIDNARKAEVRSKGHLSSFFRSLRLVSSERQIQTISTSAGCWPGGGADRRPWLLLGFRLYTMLTVLCKMTIDRSRNWGTVPDFRSGEIFTLALRHELRVSSLHSCRVFS